jgi:hypothetical protein
MVHTLDDISVSGQLLGCGGSNTDLAMEPAPLAGTTDATSIVQVMRAVPLSHRWCWSLLVGSSGGRLRLTRNRTAAAARWLRRSAHRGKPPLHRMSL